MAGSGGSGRELDATPTWAVTLYFNRKRKHAMMEALEKIKGELMVLGFISLLMTFGQNYIAKVCIPSEVADTMLPCPKKEDHLKKTRHNLYDGRGRLLWFEHRFLAGDGSEGGCNEGQVQLITAHGLHQLHIFIFFLAVFHVFYSAMTMTLGQLKIRRWKKWELETVSEHKCMNDPTRFRFTHEVSFVRGHTNHWMQRAATFYLVCFFRQFFRSVHRADYLTIRHGFITVHLFPGSKFNFQKYIKRSLADDFKVVVGISPPLWASMLLFLLLNVNGWPIVMYCISFFPLVVILAVGAKLQAIISQMAFEIKERHSVVQGIPLVKVSDRYFWLHWPQLILHMIHFVLFQNAFEITYFLWIWHEFGLMSCFHDDFTNAMVRFILGIAVQFMCSYITLPLYALVTQMGSTMKKSIFDDQTSKALKKWRKSVMHNKHDSKSEHSSHASYHSEKKFGKPLDTIALQPLSSEPAVAPATETDSSNQTANIMASVDLDGDQSRPNDKGLPFNQTPVN